MNRFTKPRSITTSLATLTLVEPGIIEQRYLDNVQFSAEGLLENLAAMETLCDHHGRCCILSIFPAGLQVKAELMNNDHYRAQRNRGHIRALAVVTDSMEMHAASKLYFMYHQQPFETRVFEEEVDALRWLRAQMEEKGAA
jgi:SpoIIAA-like